MPTIPEDLLLTPFGDRDSLPSLPYPKDREARLAYVRSRVDAGDRKHSLAGTDRGERQEALEFLLDRIDAQQRTITALRSITGQEVGE